MRKLDIIMTLNIQNFTTFTIQKKSKNLFPILKKKEKQKVYEDYNFDDEMLKKWMQNAKKQAVDLAKQTIKEVRELSMKATKEAGTKMIETFFYYAISGLLIMLLFKTCN